MCFFVDVDGTKLGKLLGFLIVLFFSGYLSIFHFDLGNVFVNIYLTFIAAGVIPCVICFSWLYFWRDSRDPFRYLSLWNCGTQLLFLSMNLMRIKVGAWGVLGILYIILSVIVVGIYYNEYHATKWGFFLTSGLVLMNVVLAFSLTLMTFDYVHPFFSSSGSRMFAVGSFVAEMSVMGAMFTSSSQLYWHEIMNKRREEALVEAIFESL
jgi:hypothetical protein